MLDEYSRHASVPPPFVPERHPLGPPAVPLAGVDEGTIRVVGAVPTLVARRCAGVIGRVSLSRLGGAGAAGLLDAPQGAPC